LEPEWSVAIAKPIGVTKAGKTIQEQQWTIAYSHWKRRITIASSWLILRSR
jgi:hypothetical protein